MPSFGLYSIPRHHLSSGQRPAPVFNTADYAVDTSTPTPTPELASLETPASGKRVKKEKHRKDDHRRDSIRSDNGVKTRNRKRSKKKNRNSTENINDAMANTELEQNATAVPLAQSPKRGPGRPKESGALSTGTSAVRTTPKNKKEGDTTNSTYPSLSSPQKRKRNSTIAEAQPLHPNLTNDHSDFNMGGDIFKDLEAVMGDMGAEFLENVQQSPVKKTAVKKKPTSNGESVRDKAANTHSTPGKKGKRAMNSNGECVAAKVNEAKAGRSNEKKSKKRKASGSMNPSAKQVPQPNHPAKQLDDEIRRKIKPKQKDVAGFDARIKRAVNEGSSERVGDSVFQDPSLVFPPPPVGTPFGVIRGSQQKRVREALRDGQVLVPETPPHSSPSKARVARTKPGIPASKLHALVPKTHVPEPTKDGGKSIPEPTTGNAVQTPASAPATITRRRPQPPVTVSLTPKNLEHLIQPLSDGPKPKMKRQSSIISAFSTMTRTSASTATDSILPPSRHEKKAGEQHKEAQQGPFDETFYSLQKGVNFTQEMVYLNSYLDWHVENDSTDPMPCLGQATGCNTKKEQIVRLGREESISIAALLDKNASGDPYALEDADNCANKAEEFIMMAVRARVPVPVGRLDGIWTLYCPKYAEHHFDRYGYGERTLTISSILGFKAKNSYTARLSIPPRPVEYSVLTFASPPHASLRTTTIKTAHEGYEMDVIFMGNGYLHLRMDLNLLLKGKPTEVVDGKKMWMEFIGVHENALKWAG
ncbi:hypothetical protein P154DRAFT_609520 [Amniculicola lignicola CBS 123094]|uniref:Uncharacterized protein n=1 Tax=Amniculicola lignicola CBS 123094 TaxID=1392246 RepID=A0A6A5W275_9PLEO|nr:hypothetical protein P154DRAFT_609520 [Amniculicola lignicola CBS 123094]